MAMNKLQTDSSVATSTEIDDLLNILTQNADLPEFVLSKLPESERGGLLGVVGMKCLHRFERTGSMEDLERAIMANERAVESTPEGHPNRAGRLNNLGNALRSRFEQTGSMEDLERAIVANEQAVESTPEGHPDRAGRLNNLGIALRSRFGRTGSIEDLEQAIVANEQAVESTPEGHRDRAARLNNLGISLQSRFEQTGSMEDLERTIMAKEQAVESTPEGHPDRAGRLNNLGNALQRRFEQTGLMEDLERAIMANERAVESTPEGHPDRAGRLNNLGNALQSRFERAGLIEDLERAIAAKEQAFKSDTAPPSIRLKAADSCSDLLIGQKSYRRAKGILRAAVKLFPIVSPRQLRLADRQFNISQFSSITSRAVSLHLADEEDAYKALQLLELGRGILANLQLEVRSDVSVLAASHSNVAKEFQELRDQIDTTSRSSEMSVIDTISNSLSNLDSSKFIAERHALHKRFDDLLRYIRSLKGFEIFLEGPSESELRSLAEGGAIVVFNVSDIRSDAFLITTDKISSIHLPLLTSDSVEDFVKRFLNAINEQDPGRYRHAKREMNGILKGLWDLAVKSVLDELGFAQMPPHDEAWPRIWWVGSGLLNILPIHASGYHDANPPQSVLDRIISSYTPSLKSLAYARERTIKASHITPIEKALLVAMPETLPYVETEIEDLRELFAKTAIATRVMKNPRRAEVLSELPKHSIVHFACHGYSANDPSQSNLLLREPLMVSDLTSLNIESAKFAYLSACDTSAMRNFHLLDESISLSSAIQLSGYPSVIGSLWQVKDSHSAQISTRIYQSILQEGTLDIRRSAEGLHKAVRDLRDRVRLKGKTDPLVWASLIHIGM
jgi:hypothetical protein